MLLLVKRHRSAAVRKCNIHETHEEGGPPAEEVVEGGPPEEVVMVEPTTARLGGVPEAEEGGPPASEPTTVLLWEVVISQGLAAISALSMAIIFSAAAVSIFFIERLRRLLAWMDAYAR